jgi:hypothetical protein
MIALLCSFSVLFLRSAAAFVLPPPSSAPSRVGRTTIVLNNAELDSILDRPKEKSGEPSYRTTPFHVWGRRETLGAASILSAALFTENVKQNDLFSTIFPPAGLSESLLQGDMIVRNLWLGRLTYPVLIVALESGLFEALHHGPLTRDQLGQRMVPSLPGAGRAMEAIVSVLSSVELLHVDQNQHVSMTDSARHVLLKDSPYFWGPQLLAADGHSP